MVRARTRSVPTEDVEQKALAEWLDQRGLVWEHIPMGGQRSRRSGRLMREFGAKKGSADNRIYDRIPTAPEVRGIAIELKRVRGGVESPEQEAWRKRLTACGWLAVVCHGAQEAVRFVTALGL